MRFIVSLLSALSFLLTLANVPSLVEVSSSKKHKTFDDSSQELKTNSRIKKRVSGWQWKDSYLREFEYLDGIIVNSYETGEIIYTDSIIQCSKKSGRYYLEDGLIKEYRSGNYKSVFEYDDGKLINITEYKNPGGDPLDELGGVTNEIEYTWDNEVIVHQREWGTPRYPNVYELSRDYYYEYDTNEDYGGVCAFFQWDSLLFDDWPEALIIQGYFGKLPKYLLRKSNDICPDGFGVEIFDWHLDSEGYPTYMEETNKRGNKDTLFFTWETVPFIAAESISLSLDSWSGKVGESVLLSATIYPEDADENSLVWTSSNENIAIVDENGMVTAISVGDADIIVSCGNITASCKVHVLPTLIESISLSPDTWQGKVGDRVSILATVAPQDATNKLLTWTSNNESVVTVDSDGLVKAVGVGSAEIKATTTDGSDITAKCLVDISAVLVESISITPYKKECIPGETFTLEVKVLPENATDKTIIWTSSDDTIATVNTNGEVTAKKVGNVTITAQANDGSNIGAICNVIVNQIFVESIELTCLEWTGFEGESLRLEAKVLPENATDKSVVWSSSDESVATVDYDGNVMAIRTGKADIMASAKDGSNVAATCHVSVNPVMVASITLSLNDWTGIEGETFQLEAKVLPENATDKSVVWSSSDESVATVDSDGNVKAVKVGESEIAATCGQVSATCKVIVNPILAESLSISPEEWSGEEGSSFSISALVLPENTTNKSLLWESSDDTIADIDDAGNVTILNKGTCLITVSTLDGSNLKAECFVTGLAGIEMIFKNGDTLVDVFTLDGILIKKNCTLEEVKQLKPALYIICNSEKMYKMYLHP